MADAMEQLIASSADDCKRGRGSEQADRSMLAEFKRRLDGATFVRLERNRRKKKVLAMRLTTADCRLPTADCRLPTASFVPPSRASANICCSLGP
jgi:hypothetical protein